MARFKIGDNPIGAHVTFTKDGKRYLLEVTDAYREQSYRGAPMLTTRHFNGERGPDVCFFAVEYLDRTTTH